MMTEGDGEINGIFGFFGYMRGRGETAGLGLETGDWREELETSSSSLRPEVPGFFLLSKVLFTVSKGGRRCEEHLGHQKFPLLYKEGWRRKPPGW
ncbi:MAG: hypothetical protein ACNS63_12385 [Candidatus Nitrospinota bacterium M3_3B_026]